MKSTANIVLKLLGLLLLTAAGLKGWQLMTEPVADADIWSNRSFLKSIPSSGSAKMRFLTS